MNSPDTVIANAAEFSRIGTDISVINCIIDESLIALGSDKR